MAVEQVFTVEQVAERVQLSTSTLMRAIRAGELEASQLTQSRGGWRVLETAIAAWIAARSNRTRLVGVPEGRAIEPSRPRRPSRRPSESSASGRIAV